MDGSPKAVLILEGPARLEEYHEPDPDMGAPYQLLVDGQELAQYVEDEVDVVNHTHYWPHSMQLPRLRITIEVLEAP